MTALGRALIVDDERFFREAIRDALTAADIDCDTAANGEEALRLAAAAGVGAVVLDLGLPGLGGIEVLRRLRAEHPTTRVVVVAAQPEQRDVLEALRLGACDYLAKPLHDEELVLSLRRALEAHAVESSWCSLRGRLRLLEARLAEIGVFARDTGPEERADVLAAPVAEAVAQTLGAGRTSLMLLDAGVGELRVAGATGHELRPDEMDRVRVGEGVAGRVLAANEALAVEDAQQDRRFRDCAVPSRYRTASFVLAPIQGPAHPVGVLCATDRADPPVFGEDDLTLLRLLALGVGPLLALPQKAGPPPAQAPGEAGPGPSLDGGGVDAELAREVCEAVTAEVQPDRLYAAALEPVARILPAAPVSLYLFDPESGELALEAQHETGVGDRARLARGRGLTAGVAESGWLVASDRPEGDPRFDPAVDTPEDGVPGPFLCVPLRLRGKVLGVLRAFPRDGASASPRTAELLGAAFSAAVRTVLLYRSLLDSVDEVAEARRALRDRG